MEGDQVMAVSIRDIYGSGISAAAMNSSLYRARGRQTAADCGSVQWSKHSEHCCIDRILLMVTKMKSLLC